MQQDTVEQHMVAVQSESVSIRKAVVKCHRGCAGGKVGWRCMHRLVVELHMVSGYKLTVNGKHWLCKV